MQAEGCKAEVVKRRLNVVTKKTADVSQEYAESIVNTVKEPLMILDSDLVVRSANASFYEMFDTTLSDIQDKPIEKILDGRLNVPPMIRRLRELSSKDVELENISTEIVIPKVGKKAVEITARKLSLPSGKAARMLVTIQMGQ
jgi:two-component system CheB/CheR fusion protein